MSLWHFHRLSFNNSICCGSAIPEWAMLFWIKRLKMILTNCGKHTISPLCSSARKAQCFTLPLAGGTRTAQEAHLNRLPTLWPWLCRYFGWRWPKVIKVSDHLYVKHSLTNTSYRKIVSSDLHTDGIQNNNLKDTFPNISTNLTFLWRWPQQQNTR